MNLKFTIIPSWAWFKAHLLNSDGTPGIKISTVLFSAEEDAIQDAIEEIAKLGHEPELVKIPYPERFDWNRSRATTEKLKELRVI